jgi:hypothetical protein
LLESAKKDTLTISYTSYETRKSRRPMMPLNLHIVTTLLTALVVPTTALLAQEVAETEPTWVGVVTTESTVRCGANDSYYGIADANNGDFVVVRGMRQDWMKVDATGPIFDNTIGYIKYPASETSVFETKDNIGTAMGEIEVLAKNIESDELYRSWRPVSRLQNGQQVEILETIVTEPGTLHRESYIVHTVALPKASVGWINSAVITKATPEQTAMFYGVDFEEATDLTEVALVLTDATAETGVFTEGEDCDDKNIMVVEEVVLVDESTNLEPLSLVELEAAWKKITAEPVMGAEVAPLEDMYAELLLEQYEDLVVQQIAGNRIKQLRVWSGLQEQRTRIELLRANLIQGSDDVSEYRSVMSMFGDYALVGTLTLSNTFDGRLRPFMYRVQNGKSGRTLGYLPANEDWELSGLVGQSVGIVGKTTWNPNWRVNVVEATRFDILSPTTATVTPDIQ